MKIKTKLILNMIIGAFAVWSIVITSVFALNFIKSKLFYLTQKSTPYQIHTVELQKDLQTAITDLVKVSSARNNQEYQNFKAEADKSLTNVKATQRVLEEMSNSKMEATEELSQIAEELFNAALARITTDKTASDANIKIAGRLKESSGRLKELDKRIRLLQAGRAKSFAAAMKDTSGYSAKQRGVEELRNLIKDLQMIFITVQNAQKSTTVLIAKGKINSVMGRIGKNDYHNSNETIARDSKQVSDRLAEYIQLQSATLTAKDDAAKAKSTETGKSLSESLNALYLTLDQEVTLAGERVATETQKQGNIYGQSNAANSILLDNSELVALGIMMEGLTNRLFTLETSDEIDKLDPEIRVFFSKINERAVAVERMLTTLDAKDEIKILKGVVASLSGIRNDLYATDGIINALKKHLAATDQAVKAGDKLLSVVLKQAEKGKESVNSARGEQEKAISAVNKMVKSSIILLIAIGSVAAVIGTFFGVWSFRSVVSPLTKLVEVAESVAEGNLNIREIKKSSDEFGQVQRAMDKMLHNLRDMVASITETTSTVAKSSQELASTADELERNSKNQTSGIETTVTSMTEMTQTIQDVSSNTLNTSDSAARMKQIALEGQKALDDTSKELFAFADIVKQSAEKTESLGTKSEAINEIVKIIKDIADQTNLLALNASIEAARAGEMGRGFAVVADSVKQLAQRTIESSGEISQTVREMREEVDSSVVIMNKERKAIEGIIEHINGTLSSMGDIVSHVEQVFVMVQTIAIAAEEQSATAEDVNRTMIGINGVTRQLSLSVVEIKRTSENFAKLAGDLQQMVGWFKL
ncbi:MAG: methyl-accepting chemotaxis protein [Desulfuromonadaceae bacterium]|nr:methyl-accepting chemotaxis protein [Desulfuromonadaceae bacterium]MDD2856078.1 methyl-accepting chemotaxis protein [Desulfuromonadaceae bacterium]